jgi:putative oxidoreductase
MGLSDKLSGRLGDAALAALRMITGAMYLFHGLQKIFGVLATHGHPEAFSQIWIGGVIELVCGTLVMVGLATRPAAFLASGTSAVAYIQFHWKLSFGKSFFPIVNLGELAVLYCFVFLFLAARGGGAASLDRLLFKKPGAAAGSGPAPQ